MVDWEGRWQGVEPGRRWDIGRSEPALDRLVESGDLPNGKCLVPGCGRGYAVATLATKEREVIGLDISTTGVTEARKYLESLSLKDTGRVAKIEQADFFNYGTSNHGEFDMVYDCTFFCAIDPSLRQTWGKKMAELIRKGGELVALNFPVGSFDGGPPFAVDLNEFEQIMSSNNFKKIMMEKVPDDEVARKMFGEEYISRWRKE